MRRVHRSAAHDQQLRPTGDSAERCRVRAGHPNLRAEGRQRIVERFAPGWIEMSLITGSLDLLKTDPTENVGTPKPADVFFTNDLLPKQSSM